MFSGLNPRARAAPRHDAMTPIDPSVLRPGRRLPCALFTRQGVKLLAAGTVLSEDMVLTLRTAHRSDLYMADSVLEMHERDVLVEREQQPRGRTAREDLVTVGGVLALEAGHEVEEHHADAYALGAFRGRDEREDTRLRAQRLKLSDQLIAERQSLWEKLRRECPRGVAPLDLPRTDAPGWPEGARLERYRADRTEVVRRLLARLVAGLPTDAAAPLELVDDLIEKQLRWPQRFVQLALLMPRAADYLPDHCFTTAVLSIGIAARLGFGAHDVRLAGLAGLLADVGMALVPKEIRVTERPLTDVEINRVWRHPTYSVVLLDALDGLPEEVRLAAYQHHERENGAGYPHGLRGPRITDLARVVAVADAFAAATEPRPYKPRKLPYAAIEELITVGSQKLYDRRTVRALVESAGLFPIGSVVKLSSGEPAIVIGIHADRIDRPIVRVLRRSDRAPHAGRGAVLSAANPRGVAPPPLHDTPRDPDHHTAPGEIIDLAAIDPWKLHVLQAIEMPGDARGRAYAA